MGLLDKWNKNKFSIYKSEEKTVLKLIESIGKWLEDLIKVTENKTDLYGDHKGSWQGLNKPTLSEEGMRATVEKHIEEISNLKNEDEKIYTEITNLKTEDIGIEKNRMNTVGINRVVPLPSNISLPFTVIHNNGYKAYFSEVEGIKKQAKKIYISSFIRGTGLGEEGKEAITLNRFKYNFTNNLYPGVNKFRLIFIDKFYFADGNDLTIESENIHISFESGCGFTWLGYAKTDGIKTSTSWTLEDGIGVIEQTDVHDIQTLVNMENLDINGMPHLYRKVSSLALCKAEKGTFYQEGVKIYCNKLDLHDYKRMIMLPTAGCIDIRQTGEKIYSFENMGFMGDSLSLVPNNLNTRIYLNKCKFFRGLTDGFKIDGKYKVFLKNCVSAYPSKDCFNYHSTSKDSIAVEINCKGYGAGQYKFTNTTTDDASNNGSTAHNGMIILRFGSSYWNCQGAIVADIENCYSINYDVTCKDILPTTGIRASFRITNDESSVRYREDLVNKYIINCYGGGTNTEYGIYGDEYTKVYGFSGNYNYYGNVDIKKEEFLNYE